MRKTNKPYVKDEMLFDADISISANLPIQVGSKFWFAWLEMKDGFTYQGSIGHFTARRELRRGISYWYGYRRRDGKLSKVYLGKSEELSREKLEKASALLAGQALLQRLVADGSSANVISGQTPQSSTIISSVGLSEDDYLPPLTKITPPALPKKLIARPRLTQRINKPVTVIYAPSGYGTSTVLNEWRQDCGMPVAWVSLDADDNHPLHFWSTIVTALRMINPRLGQDWLSQLHNSSPSALSTIVVNLTNDIVRATDPSNLSQWMGLILDNYHSIRNTEIHTSLQTLLDHLPPTLRVVISSHKKPPLTLGYLRAKGMVAELGVEDLRFTLEEGIEYLLQNTPAPFLAYSQMQELITRTEGWVTGLAYAISVLTKEENRSLFKGIFNGAHPLLREFFMENVLHQQPLEVQTFLLKSSILKNLTGSLCDTITGKSDSAELLVYLWEENLFLERLEKPGWYWVHNLLKEVLSVQLREQFPSEILQLHREAAGWYYAQNEVVEAIFHFLAGKSWEDAATLIETVALNELEQFGEDSRILGWLLQLPEEVLQKHKILFALYIRLAGISFPPSEVDGFLMRIEKNISSEPTNSGLETLTEIQQFRKLWVTNDQGISEISTDGGYDNVWQMLDGILQYHRDFRRDVIRAELRANTMYETAQGKNDLYAILMAGGACANLALSQGHLRRSEQIAQKVLHQAFSLCGKFPEPTCIPLITLSGVYFLRNQLALAHQYLVRATELNPTPTSTIEPVSIAIQRAKIQSAQGDNEAAFSTIQAARELYNQRPSSIWVDQDLIAYLKLFRLRKGDLDTTADLLPIERGEMEVSGISALVQAEILIAQNRSVAAEDLLTRLLEQYPHGSFMIPILRARVILAIALFEQRKLKEACNVLVEVSRLAAPEYCIRPFLDSGPKIVSLLSLVLHSEHLNSGIQTFLKGVLTMLGEPNGIQRILPSKETTELAIAASISPREREILKLLSAGFSNREIAAKCSISTSTVKTHIENIYRKLGVNSRLQAIAQAQMLNLM